MTNRIAIDMKKVASLTTDDQGVGAARALSRAAEGAARLAGSTAAPASTGALGADDRCICNALGVSPDVLRTAPSPDGGGSSSVALSAGDRKMARRLGLTDEQMAAEKPRALAAVEGASPMGGAHDPGDEDDAAAESKIARMLGVDVAEVAKHRHLAASAVQRRVKGGTR